VCVGNHTTGVCAWGLLVGMPPPLGPVRQPCNSSSAAGVCSRATTSNVCCQMRHGTGIPRVAAVAATAAVQRCTHVTSCNIPVHPPLSRKGCAGQAAALCTAVKRRHLPLTRHMSCMLPPRGVHPTNLRLLCCRLALVSASGHCPSPQLCCHK
jgi:hypothetical protein